MGSMRAVICQGPGRYLHCSTKRFIKVMRVNGCNWSLSTFGFLQNGHFSWERYVRWLNKTPILAVSERAICLRSAGLKLAPLPHSPPFLQSISHTWGTPSKNHFLTRLALPLGSFSFLISNLVPIPSQTTSFLECVLLNLSSFVSQIILFFQFICYIVSILFILFQFPVI